MYNAEDILGYIKLCLYCWEWHSRPQGANTTPDAGMFLIVNLCINYKSEGDIIMADNFRRGAVIYIILSVIYGNKIYHL